MLDMTYREDCPSLRRESALASYTRIRINTFRSWQTTTETFEAADRASLFMDSVNEVYRVEMVNAGIELLNGQYLH
jgi:hypothetical protein